MAERGNVLGEVEAISGCEDTCEREAGHRQGPCESQYLGAHRFSAAKQLKSTC